MRPLNPDEAAAWGRVMATVRPLKAAVLSRPRTPARAEAPTPHRNPEAPAGGPSDRGAFAQAMAFPQRVRTPRAVPQTPPAPRPAPGGPGETLDASWDRRLGRGMVVPDSSVDLHGHTLASAHALLDQGLDQALRRGDRVLLLVTGKPPRPESERPHARGAIRAAVADWLAASRFADRIAAVRGAHPRHGGQGALYLVLRRPRGR